MATVPVPPANGSAPSANAPAASTPPPPPQAPAQPENLGSGAADQPAQTKNAQLRKRIAETEQVLQDAERWIEDFIAGLKTLKLVGPDDGPFEKPADALQVVKDNLRMAAEPERNALAAMRQHNKELTGEIARLTKEYADYQALVEPLLQESGVV